MPRHVQPELLDSLPPLSAEAQRSRMDLQRINALMGNARQLGGALRPFLPATDRPWNVAELGAGDARQTARVWSRLPRPPPESRLRLIDQFSLIAPAARARLEQQGWQVEGVESDALAWLETPAEPPLLLLYANLFIHHFEANTLRELLRRIAERTDTFVALEPRRGWFPSWAVRGLRLLGHHPVTRHDALRSVQAGFRGRELREAWPDAAGWVLREGRSGWFGHLLVATRRAHS